MKKILAIVLLVSAILLCGCSTVGDFVNQLADSSSPKMTVEDMYSELDRLIGYTAGMERTDLNGSFTFIAMVADSGEEMFFEDEDYTGFFYFAYISRNWDDGFYLETTGLDTDLESGDIIKVTGELDGTIYWTEDNDKVEVVSVKASAVEPYTPEELVTSNSPSFTLSNGDTIEFIGAHATEDIIGEAVVVYFKFTNNGESAAAPNLRDFIVDYDGSEASMTILGLDEVDSSALSMGIGLTDKTYAGKSQLYYIAYSGKKDIDSDFICFSRYDDEFRCTYDYDIPVAASLAELKG